MSREEAQSKKEKLGHIIFEKREASGLTLRDVAKFTKLHKKYVANVEKGNARVKKGPVLRIVRIFVLTKTETETILGIISELCSFVHKENKEEKSFQRNYSRHTKKRFPQKRYGEPSDHRAMRLSLYKISCR